MYKDKSLRKDELETEIRYMFRPFIICCLLIGMTNSLLAQEKTGEIIDHLKFEGLKKTQESFLLFFLESLPGTPITAAAIESDIQTLKNISGIGNASYRVDTFGAQIHLVYRVEEVKTLLPIINFGGIKGNLWFQAGFTDINWRGKGQNLSAAYQNNDRRHSGQIFYKVPWYKAKPWGFSASLTKWSSREPVFFSAGTVNYDYDNNSIALSVIRHLGYRRNLELGGTFFIEKYTKSELQFLDTPPGPATFRQPKYLSKLVYNEDFLNYHLFYLKGYSWRLAMQNVYNTVDKNWFNTLQFQGRAFRRFGNKGNLAMRLRLAISTNNETPFAPFVVDSHVNLRGVGNRIDRGTAQAVFNAEYRQTIYEANKWGAQLVAFSDIGTWRKPGGDFNDLWNSDHFRHFIGGGFRIIYQKVFGGILRVDYGFDVFNKNQNGIVIGLGQYF
ncbi:MAG: BamA/TamA family outer membrane protein [Saprospiraceae bacterium]